MSPRRGASHISVRHTEAAWAPHGGFVPAPIDTRNLRKSQIESKSKYTLTESSVGVLDCIVAPLGGWIFEKNISKVMIYGLIHCSERVSK